MLAEVASGTSGFANTSCAHSPLELVVERFRMRSVLGIMLYLLVQWDP